MQPATEATSGAKLYQLSGHFLQIPWVLEAHLEKMPPLARKLLKAAIDLTAQRPNFSVNAGSLGRHVAAKYGEAPPSKDGARKAWRWLRERGFVRVLPHLPGCVKFKIRIAGIHPDGPKVPDLHCSEGEKRPPIFATPSKPTSDDRNEPLGHADPPPLDHADPPPLALCDPPVTRSPLDVPDPPPAPRAEPEPESAIRNAKPEGGGATVEEIREAWRPKHEDRGSPIERRTVERAIASARKSNPEATDEQIRDTLKTHAKTWSVPERTKHPILRFAAQNFAALDVPEARAGASAYRPFEDEPERPAPMSPDELAERAAEFLATYANS